MGIIIIIIIIIAIIINEAAHANHINHTSRTKIANLWKKACILTDCYISKNINNLQYKQPTFSQFEHVEEELNLYTHL